MRRIFVRVIFIYLQLVLTDVSVGDGVLVRPRLRSQNVLDTELAAALSHTEALPHLKRYPAFSLVELLQYCALIGRELQSVEIFPCMERFFYRS